MHSFVGVPESLAFRAPNNPKRNAKVLRNFTYKELQPAFGCIFSMILNTAV